MVDDLASAQERIAEAQRIIDERAARKLALAAAKKAYWDEYHEQLAKSTPYGGGANRRKSRVFRLW